MSLEKTFKLLEKIPSLDSEDLFVLMMCKRLKEKTGESDERIIDVVDFINSYTVEVKRLIQLMEIDYDK